MTEIKEIKLRQKQSIPYNSTYIILKQLLIKEFEAVEEMGLSTTKDIHTEDTKEQDALSNKSNKVLKVGGIKIKTKDDEIIMELESCYLDNVIAMTINKAIKEIGTNVIKIRMSKMNNKRNTSRHIKELLHQYRSKSRLNIF